MGMDPIKPAYESFLQATDLFHQIIYFSSNSLTSINTMELLYKLLATRLDFYYESTELMERIVRIPDLAPQIKRRLSNLKLQEKYIQVHEDE